MKFLPERAAGLPRRLVALSACLVGGVALAAPPHLPPLGGSGPAEHHSGKIIWADLVTPDLAKAEAFYTRVFGWSYRAVRGGHVNYAVALVDGRPIAGLLQQPLPSGERRQPAWLTFIAAQDVDAATQSALKLGAVSVSEARTYPGRGRQSVLADPEGAVFAVLASSSGDPPDVLAAPGEWIWSSLLVRDPAQEAGFYKTLFGYDVFDLPGDESAVHVILSTDDYARASVNSLPAGGHRRPHWLNFIRVDNAADAVARAVSAGGRVLVEPYEDRHGGHIAVIADPAGAPIGLMEWSDTDTKVEPK